MYHFFTHSLHLYPPFTNFCTVLITLIPDCIGTVNYSHNKIMLFCGYHIWIMYHYLQWLPILMFIRLKYIVCTQDTTGRGILHFTVVSTVRILLC